MRRPLPPRAIVALIVGLIVVGVLLLIASAHGLVHDFGIVSLYAGYMALIWLARQRSNQQDARRSASWRRALSVFGLLSCVAVIASTALNTAGTFYHPPRPTRRAIEVKSVESTEPVAGDTSSLTTLPYLVIGYGDQVTYAASNSTAKTIRRGGRFTCTITKPINDQISRAAACVAVSQPG